MNPLVCHVEPADRETLLQGNVLPLEELELVTLHGPWDQGTNDFANRLLTWNIQSYLYLQVHTAPLPEWLNTEPMTTMGALPVIPLVKSWAYGRDSIDWSMTQLPLPLHPTGGIGLFLDNYFPDLEPWMFRKTSWAQLPSLGSQKRKAYARQLMAFSDAYARVIHNGRPQDKEGQDFIMVERAAARKTEATARVRSDKPTLLSIPCEETYNFDWLFNLWTEKDGTALSFTGDSPQGLASPASVAAYQQAIHWRATHT